MPTIYRPRRPRASPLWQIHHGWDEFQSIYEAKYRKTHGPLRTDTVEVVEKFYRCGDLARAFKAGDFRPETLGRSGSPCDSILHPPSSILHPPSSILHPPSSILHPPSSILHPPSSILHPPSSGLMSKA